MLKLKGNKYRKMGKSWIILHAYILVIILEFLLHFVSIIIYRDVHVHYNMIYTYICTHAWQVGSKVRAGHSSDIHQLGDAS